MIRIMCFLLLCGVLSSCNDGAVAPTKAINHAEVRECLDYAIQQMYKYYHVDDTAGVGGLYSICDVDPFVGVCKCAKYKEQYEKKYRAEKDIKECNRD